jgi:glycerol kinase
MGKYILVIDEGTTGTRALVIDKDFNIVSQAYQEITTYTPADDKVEQNAVEIWDKSFSCCMKALSDKGIKAQEIDSIGIANQRNTTVVWDKTTGDPLYNAITWQDTRTADIVTRAKSTPDYEKVHQVTGKVYAVFCVGLFVRWLMDNVPLIKEKIEKGEALVGTIDTWLIYKLTGGKSHATSFNNASSAGMIDLSTNKWSQWFMDSLKLPMSILPEIKSESADYGTCELFGAPIKITGVTADQQGSLFALGCYEEGMVKCTNGTGTFLDVNIGEKCAVPKANLDALIGWNLNGKTVYAIEGFESVTGKAVQFLRDSFEFFAESKETEALASSVPDSNGVYFVPALTGLITPQQDPYARGLIIGLTLGVKKAHVVRATLEAIALRTRDIIDVVESELGVKIGMMSIDGGVSKNNLVAQMFADYMQARIVRPASIEATAIGAAQFAGLHTGFYSRDDLKKVHKIESEFTPKLSDK